MDTGKISVDGILKYIRNQGGRRVLHTPDVGPGVPEPPAGWTQHPGSTISITGGPVVQPAIPVGPPSALQTPYRGVRYPMTVAGNNLPIPAERGFTLGAEGAFEGATRPIRPVQSIRAIGYTPAPATPTPTPPLPAAASAPYNASEVVAGLKGVRGMLPKVLNNPITRTIGKYAPAVAAYFDASDMQNAYNRGDALSTAYGAVNTAADVAMATPNPTAQLVGGVYNTGRAVGTGVRYGLGKLGVLDTSTTPDNGQFSDTAKALMEKNYAAQRASAAPAATTVYGPDSPLNNEAAFRAAEEATPAKPVATATPTGPTDYGVQAEKDRQAARIASEAQLAKDVRAQENAQLRKTALEDYNAAKQDIINSTNSISSIIASRNSFNGDELVRAERQRLAGHQQRLAIAAQALGIEGKDAEDIRKTDAATAANQLGIRKLEIDKDLNAAHAEGLRAEAGYKKKLTEVAPNKEEIAKAQLAEKKLEAELKSQAESRKVKEAWIGQKATELNLPPEQVEQAVNQLGPDIEHVKSDENQWNPIGKRRKAGWYKTGSTQRFTPTTTASVPAGYTPTGTQTTDGKPLYRDANNNLVHF